MAMAGHRRRRADSIGLLPVVIAAGLFLLALKGAAVLFHFELTGPAIDRAQAQESDDGKAKATAEPKEKTAEAGKTGAASGDGRGEEANAGQQAGVTKERPRDITEDDDAFVSRSERAVLQSLAKRRAELDRREREIDLKLKLLKAAEKKVTERISELKEIEARIETRFGQEEERKNAKLKNIVTLYENMKPQEAARILDRLDMDVLVDLVGQVTPRKMARIMADMRPEVAERLTLELAARAGAAGSSRTGELPSLPERSP